MSQFTDTLELPASQYTLIDSGEGEKLERLGPRTIARPSSLCIWRRKRPEAWREADARFIPGEGWKFQGARFEEWRADLGEIGMLLRLQSNGQVGVFPEHFSYLNILSAAAGNATEKPAALNLFAFTGLATVHLAKSGWSVCHVDLSKRALEWAAQNLALNGLQGDSSNVRLIAEDALKFLERELRRQNRYDLVIADPPSFSRVTKQQTWELEQVASELISACLSLLRPGGTFVCTSHHAALSGEVMANLVFDQVPADRISITSAVLGIAEADSPRRLPSGHLMTAKLI